MVNRDNKPMPTAQILFIRRLTVIVVLAVAYWYHVNISQIRASGSEWHNCHGTTRATHARNITSLLLEKESCISSLDGHRCRLRHMGQLVTLAEYNCQLLL